MIEDEGRLFNRVWAAVDDLVAGADESTAEPGDDLAFPLRPVQTFIVTIDTGDDAIEAARIDGWGWVLLGADKAGQVPSSTCAFAERLDPRAATALDRLLADDVLFGDG